jgi:hypothetical protein
MACRTCDTIRGLLLAQDIPESIAGPASQMAGKAIDAPLDLLERKVKRKASAYSKKYGKAFKKIAKKFKKKNGSWKVNGFKNAQKAAHKLAKRMR